MTPARLNELLDGFKRDHDDLCIGESRGPCTCGADTHNARVEEVRRAVGELAEALRMAKLFELPTTRRGVIVRVGDGYLIQRPRDSQYPGEPLSRCYEYLVDGQWISVEESKTTAALYPTIQDAIAAARADGKGE